MSAAMASFASVERWGAHDKGEDTWDLPVGGDAVRLLSVVPDAGPIGGRRPSLRVRRRRAAMGAFVLAVVVLLALPPGAFGAHRPAVASGPRITTSTYTVLPGDSMWTIAERVDPGGDPRVLVAQLEARTGSSTVYPGEVLTLH